VGGLIMITDLRGKTLSVLVLFFINIFFIPLASVNAAWYFNWSCGSPIGTPGGRQGPYSDKSACESDLASARSACESARGSFSGWCSGSDDSGTSPSYQRPAPDQGEIQRRRIEEEKLRKEAEEEAMRREEEAKKNFEKSKQEALDLMKRGGSDTLTIKSGSNTSTSTPTTPFGIKGTPGTPEGLEIKSGMPEEAVNRAVMTWACATWIADFVFPAARKGDVSEVRFLEEQVRKALGGEKPGVDCPKLSPPPHIQGVAIGTDSPGIKFYGALIKAVFIQAEQLARTSQEIAQFLGKQQVTNEDIRKLEQELKAQEKTKPTVAKKDKVESRKEKEKPKEEVKPPAAETKKDEEDSVAKALAALKKAQEAKKKIDNNEGLHKQVQASPSLAEKLIGKIEK
jgi:hypothetical protein